jgi:hypothetical protein
MTSIELAQHWKRQRENNTPRKTRTDDYERDRDEVAEEYNDE